MVSFPINPGSVPPDTIESVPWDYVLGFAPHQTPDLPTDVWIPGGKGSLPDTVPFDFGLGGAGGGVDHFFDVNPLDQAFYDETVRMNNYEIERNNALDAWNRAMDERDYALALGELDLARQRQQDANFWQGESLRIEAEIAAAANATRERVAAIGAQASVESSRISAEATIRSAEIAAATARADSTNRLRVGLANAFNDQERNAVLARWNEEQAAIAKMEDYTNRLIQQTSNQVRGFEAETQRANVMGQLAQRQNEFLLEAVTSPRDLFGLYFLQRGFSPDFGTITGGGTPAEGTPLVPVNPLTAFVPTLELPNFDFGNPYEGTVGGATAAATAALQNNPFFTQSLAGIDAQQGGGSGSGGSGSGSGNRITSTVDFGSPPARDISGPREMPDRAAVPPHLIDINPGGLQGGVPLAGLRPGLNLSTVGGEQPVAGSAFTIPTFYDIEMTRPVSPEDSVAPGTQVFVNYDPERLAGGGFTNETVFTVGDAAHPNPEAGGAKPETVINPTGAPVQVIPHRDNVNTMNAAFPDFGANRTALRILQDYGRMLAPRFALGTGDYSDIAQQYADLGLGNLWIGSSDNTHLQGMDLPPALQALADFGVPISPALLSSVTGGQAPTLNVADVFRARGGGGLPALQTLANQTVGENQLFLEGFGQSVVGIPAQDIADFIGRPTRALRTAQQSFSTV